MSAHMRLSPLLTTVLLASVVTLASIGNAQPVRSTDAPPRDTAGVASTAALSGPRVVQGGVLNQSLAPAPFEVPQPRDRVGAGSNLALMGVGLAALIIGLTIDGDAGTVIAVSGGVLGLVGLYRYLR
jgi:hypothetical protein